MAESALQIFISYITHETKPKDGDKKKAENTETIPLIPGIVNVFVKSHI